MVIFYSIGNMNMYDVENLLQNFLGMKVRTRTWDGIKHLPLYLSRSNEFCIAGINDQYFLLAKVKDHESRNIHEFKAMLRKLEEASGLPVLFVLDRIGSVEREALIKARIEFISLPDQAYMPSLGILLKSKRTPHQAYRVPEKLTASGQILYLLMQYRGNAEISKSDAAEQLGMPVTTMTHAADQLQKLNLIHCRKDGKTIYMSPSDDGYAYYLKTQPYLISPVLQSFLVRKEEIRKQGIACGEALLSRQSDLAMPQYQSRAFYKKDEVLKQLHPVSSQWSEDEDLVQVEVWRYDPALFAQKDGVDPVSLACTFSGLYDERLEDAVRLMLKEKLNARQ